MLKIGELFCGAGGFAEGAKQAGFSHLWGTDYDHKTPVKHLKKPTNVRYLPLGVIKFTR